MRNPRPVSRTQRAFTLLEILVVVGVITVIASTILLNLTLNRPDNVIRDHASRVGKTLQLLMQEAILDDKNYALSVVPRGFLVLEYDGAQWQQSEDPFILSLYREHDYRDELVIDRKMVTIEKSDPPQPHILILSSGEMTVFQWDISDPINELQVRLQSSMLGQIVMEGPMASTL